MNKIIIKFFIISLLLNTAFAGDKLPLSLKTCQQAKEDYVGNSGQKAKNNRGRNPNRALNNHFHTSCSDHEKLIALDLNGDGYISDEELEKFVKKANDEMLTKIKKCQKRYNKMILNRFDKDKNGKLDSQEKATMKKAFEEMCKRRGVDRTAEGIATHYPHMNVQKQRVIQLLNAYLQSDTITPKDKEKIKAAIQIIKASK